MNGTEAQRRPRCGERPQVEAISSHTARRTAITVNVLRGNNIHGIKKCSGHSDLRVFDNYIRDDN